jgi:hypothetical protein
MKKCDSCGVRIEAVKPYRLKNPPAYLVYLCMWCADSLCDRIVTQSELEEIEEELVPKKRKLKIEMPDSITAYLKLTDKQKIKVLEQVKEGLK